MPNPDVPFVPSRMFDPKVTRRGDSLTARNQNAITAASLGQTVAGEGVVIQRVGNKSVISASRQRGQAPANTKWVEYIGNDL